MEGFVQEVFNEISLERDPKLWQSSDDGLTAKRISLLRKFPEARFASQLQRNRRPLSKNDLIAEKFLDKGTEFLVKKGDANRSLTALNQALVLTSDDLLKRNIYRTRAKVLFKLKLYQPCLSDITLCDVTTIDEDDDDLELAVIKCKSLSSLNRFEEAGKIAVKLLKRNDLGQDQSDTLKNLFNQKRNESGKSLPDPGFSPDAVEIKSAPAQGRFVVAKKDLEPGDLLAVDSPDVRMPGQDFVRTHCWNCLVSTRAQYACPACSGVIFCSPRCQEQADQVYHRYECGNTDLLYQSKIGVWMLALRATCVFSERPFPYVTHTGSRDFFSAPELMKESLVALFLARLLIQGGFHLAEGDDEQELTLRVHEIMRGINFNCHEVIGKQADTGKMICIGFALNPRLSLFNHSCDPNYGRVWLKGGQRALAFATRPIKAGEQIFDSYSGIFAKCPKDERSPINERYNFLCGCQACLEDWPLFSQLEGSIADKELKAALRREAKNKNNLEATQSTVKKAFCKLKQPHKTLVELEEKLHSVLWEEHTQLYT